MQLLCTKGKACMLALNMIDYIPDVEGSAEYFRVSLPKPQTQTQNITLGAAPAAQQAQQSAGAHRPPELASGSGLWSLGSGI